MLFVKKTIRDLFFLIGVLFFSSFCYPKTEWIRNLPPDAASNKSDRIKKNPIPLGIYLRPSEKKSPMKSLSHHYEWTESIYISKGNQFTKEYREKNESPDETKFKIISGKGNYKQQGVWVLFETNSIQKIECSPEKTKWKTEDWKKTNLCSHSPDSVSFSHSLLYHYKTEDQSLAPMQYESGYTESSFGIVWESKEPYKEDILFKKARDKFTKKEFQPHVYYYGRLD
ncbi:hypothetical protein [Leptospira ilyithenensis]|uniref:Uncharacterized protein n=1 Tax=Leptospira ilyithenensis TaxID=2484901 RepID=A0A4V3JXR1_9LEPT|nr:hypothetical protein [Leptospira ilyithenensis]TGN16783.1 hypothetical protein EHS11_00235 [Leptospira ilyithenensis]